MELIKDIISENWIGILTSVFIFLSGIAVGAGITDALNNMKGDEDGETVDRRRDRVRKEKPGHDKSGDRKEARKNAKGGISKEVLARHTDGKMARIKASRDHIAK